MTIGEIILFAIEFISYSEFRAVVFYSILFLIAVYSTLKFMKLI